MTKIRSCVGVALVTAPLFTSHVQAGVTNLETGEHWWPGQDGDVMNELEEWAEEEGEGGTILPDHWDPIRISYREMGDVCTQMSTLLDLADPDLRSLAEGLVLTAGQIALEDIEMEMEEQVLWIHFEASTPALESVTCSASPPWTSEVELVIPVEVKPWLSSTKSGEVRITGSISTRNVLVNGAVSSTQTCLDDARVTEVDIPRLDGWIVNSLESALEDMFASRLCF
jgi:hypothetical protein